MYDESTLTRTSKTSTESATRGSTDTADKHVSFSTTSTEPDVPSTRSSDFWIATRADCKSREERPGPHGPLQPSPLKRTLSTGIPGRTKRTAKRSFEESHEFTSGPQTEAYDGDLDSIISNIAEWLGQLWISEGPKEAKLDVTKIVLNSLLDKVTEEVGAEEETEEEEEEERDKGEEYRLTRGAGGGSGLTDPYEQDEKASWRVRWNIYGMVRSPSALARGARKSS